VKRSPFQQTTRKIEDFMTLHARAFQVMTYPLIGKSNIEKSGLDPQQTLKLVNALSEDHDRMRTSCIPSMLDAVELNRKNLDEFRLFEVARVYTPGKDSYVSERPMLAIAYYQREESRPCFLPLLNDVERLLNHLQVPAELVGPNQKFPSQVIPLGWSWTHPYEHQDVKIMGKVSGSVFSVHPLLLRQYKIKGHVSLALIDMDEWQQKEFKSRIKYTPISKFPSVTFDCTVIAPKDTQAGIVLSALGKLKLPELEWAKIVGVFVGSDGRPCITLKTYFIDREKTMQPERIKQLENAIVEQLEKSGFPLKK
jgi:phenylalanyl-tRNA synthetase beta chain